LHQLRINWTALHACFEMVRQEATMLYLSATQSTSRFVPDLHSEHVRATSLVSSQFVKHALT